METKFAILALINFIVIVFVGYKIGMIEARLDYIIMKLEGDIDEN